MRPGGATGGGGDGPSPVAPRGATGRPLRERTLGVLGLGLLGGSLAGRVRAVRAAAGVRGFDRDRGTCARALERGLVDAVEPPEALARSCDVLILAVPWRALEEASGGMLRAVREAGLPGGGPGAVLDLCSAQVGPARLLEAHWGERHAGFHPMAGKERGGVEEADPDLFRGRTCAVVPTARTGAEPLALAEELAEALGAGTIRLDPATHDALVAAVSHLPQLVASALALTAEEERLRFPDALPRLAAGGYRDTTRVAACPPWLGSDMVGANAPEIRRLLRRFRAHLESLLEEPAEVRDERFRAASEARSRLLGRPEG